MHLLFDSDMVDLLLKLIGGGGERRLNVVGRQLFCDLVRCHD